MTNRAAVPTMIALALILAAGAAGAQAPPAAQKPSGQPPPTSGPPPSCGGPEYRQFDFWLGDWNVTASGQLAGTNLITSEVAGCVVHEHWKGTKGGSGESFNFYDRHDGKWHQLWVGSGGGVVRLTGSYADGKMAFTGEAVQPGGQAVSARMTFFNNESEKTVRQLWETSSDNGKTWQVAFDGVYSRKP